VCSPAAIPYVLVATAAAASTTQAVMANQTAQHAKGAAQAQETAAKNAEREQGKIGPSATAAPPKPDFNGQEEQRRKAALRAGLLSTVGTSPTGAKGTPNIYEPRAGGKTLLGA